MATRILQQVRQAVGNLNPQEVRGAAERKLAVRLVASDDAGYRAMANFLSPADTSRAKRAEQARAVFREDDPEAPEEFDLEIYEDRLDRPEGAFSFDPGDPERCVRDILAAREELGLPLARYFPAFRERVVEKVITSVARENATFSIVTALPNIVPAITQLPWAVGEFGSDTAFLTVNQIRMLFLIGAANDRPVGYGEQRAEIASLIAGAFGFRALARELVGKIPFGGGIVPKAAVAFAGTYVVGRSADRLYRIGSRYTRKERRALYEEAFERGKKLAGLLVRNIRRERGSGEAR